MTCDLTGDGEEVTSREGGFEQPKVLSSGLLEYFAPFSKASK